jgi:ATP-dependent metalloprotease
MLKLAIRNFCYHKTLKELNRNMQFLEVKQKYEKMNIKDPEESILCKDQYLYALKYLQYLHSINPNEKKLQFLLTPGALIEESHLKNSSSSLLRKLVIAIFVLGEVLYLIYKNFPSGGNTIFSEDHIKIAQYSNLRFLDVKGIDECKSELEEIVDFLKYPHKYRQSGARMPKGVLLVGQPGCGKTLLAKAIAGEAGVPFYYSSGSEFDEMYVGLGSKRIRELFYEAKRNSPCIVFIDELDAIGNSRNIIGIRENRQTLNELLSQMDGFSQTENLIVIGATNMPEILDPAIKRSGRFDKIIDIPVPDRKGRVEMIEYYLSQIKYDKKIDINDVANKTIGMTGADISNLINIAALHAVKTNKETCEESDIEYAFDRIKLGVELKSYTMSEKEIMNTSYHETGHALVAHYSKGSSRYVNKVTILPRGRALGFTSILNNKDKKDVSRQYILSSLDTFMGGRAAEEIFSGPDNITSGCASDLKIATEFAYEALSNGLFNDLVGFNVPSKVDYLGSDKRNSYDKAVGILLSQAYERALDILKTNKNTVLRVAKELRKRETLTREEFLQIINQ